MYKVKKKKKLRRGSLEVPYSLELIESRLQLSTAMTTARNEAIMTP
jgi:hypothetical protein